MTECASAHAVCQKCFSWWWCLVQAAMRGQRAGPCLGTTREDLCAAWWDSRLCPKQCFIWGGETQVCPWHCAEPQWMGRNSELLKTAEHRVLLIVLLCWKCHFLPVLLLQGIRKGKWPFLSFCSCSYCDSKPWKAYSTLGWLGVLSFH